MSAQGPSADGATIFDPLAIPLDRTVVVEASAGTGKTYSITLLYLRCVLERDLDPSRILVVTFTRAATAELRKRIREGLADASARIRDDSAMPPDPSMDALLVPYRGAGRAQAVARLAAALDSLDRASIFTIDGFLGRVLRQRAFETGQSFEFEVGADSKAILRNIAADRFTADYATLEAEQLGRAAYASPDDIAKLLGLTTAHPTLPVEPAAVSDADLAALEARFVEAGARYSRARAESGTKDDLIAAVKRARPRVRTANAIDDFDAIATGRRKLDVELPDSWEYVSGRSYRDLGGLEKGPCPTVFDAVDELATVTTSLARARLAHEAHALIAKGRRDFERATRSDGILTFDALKTAVHALLVTNPEGERVASVVADDYAIALVDESQDTDASQFAVFQRIFGRPGRGLVFIGDPKQAIYGFRGADIHAYLEARQAATLRTTMTRNFRSRPELLAALGALYDASPDAFGTEAIRYVDVTAGREAEAFPTVADPASDRAVEVLRCPSTSDDVDCAAADIVRLLRDGSLVRADGGSAPIRPKNLAVLCRSNSQVDAVCRALRIRGVPAVAASSRSVFETEESEDLAVFLRAVLDPSDGRAVRAALLTPLFDHDPRSLHALSKDDVAWGTVVDEFARVRSELHAKGLGFAFGRFARATGLESRLLARPDGFRIVTNLAHLVELLSRAASEKKLGAEGVLGTLERARGGEDPDASATEERALRLEHEGDAVEVATVHKSKGLEYDVVYLVGLGKPPHDQDRNGPSLVRHPRRGRLVALDPSLDDELQEARLHERLCEDARVVYVALTRAKLALRVVASEKAEKKSGIHSAGFGTTRLGVVLGGTLADGAAADGAPYFAHLAQRFASLRDAAGVSVGLRDVDLGSANSVFRPRVAPPTLLAPAMPMRRFERVSRTSSFSGLVAGAESWSPADRDRDAALESGVLAGSDPLEGVPAGRELGVLVHGVLEHVDFDATSDVIEVVVDRELTAASGFVPHRSAVIASTVKTLATPILPDGTRLADVPRGRTLRELEFQISVRNPSGFTPESLGALFSDHGIPASDSGYGDRVAKLPFGLLTGYLRGFVDLVFEHDGRFHVVDYKSNRLGGPDEYAADRLVVPMMDHHYVLQYAVYVLALHRFLRQRLRDYDYDRHVGSALYLFVRGMDASHGPASGVFAHRLPGSFVDAMDRLFDGGGS